MIITNQNNLPQALVDVVSRDYEYKDKRYSATAILKPIRQLMLERRHNKEISQDVSDMIWLIFGNAVHKLIENAPSNSSQFKEEHVEIKVGDYTLSGIIDLYDIDKEEIQDWKTASVYKYKSGDWEDYFNQVMIYAYMLTKLGFNVKTTKIVPMYKDYRKSEARKGDYPEFPIQVLENKVSDKGLAEIELMIYEKFKLIEQYEKVSDDELPLCTMEERWAKPTQYAVMKKGNKKALKLCNSEQEAKDYIGDKDYYIEKREGIDNKCTEYCSACKFCSYWKEHYGEKQDITNN